MKKVLEKYRHLKEKLSVWIAISLYITYLVNAPSGDIIAFATNARNHYNVSAQSKTPMSGTTLSLV